MKIFDQLRGLKTAASYAELIPRLEADLAAAESEVRALESRREEAIFTEGEAGIAKLQGAISAAKDRVETLKIAIDGARRRQADAAAAERNAKLEARHREGLKLTAEERRLLKAWHAAAQKLAEITAQVEAVQKAIDAENSDMKTEGRPDLVLPNLARELDEKRREIWDRHYDAFDQRPGNVLPPVNVKVGTQFSIPNYWPVQPEGRVVPVQPLAALE